MVFEELDKKEDTEIINKIQVIADQNKLFTKSEVKKLLIDYKFIMISSKKIMLLNIIKTSYMLNYSSRQKRTKTVCKFDYI